MNNINQIFKITISDKEIIENNLTQWYCNNKKKIYQLSNIQNTMSNDKITISKYLMKTKPQSVNKSENIDIECLEGKIIYKKSTDIYKQWYVNFADEMLFNYYNTALMAQDEHQVLEHPILANITEMLYTKSQEEIKFMPSTRNYDLEVNFSTPILIENAKRLITLDIFNKSTPLYGKLFEKASWNQITNMLTVNSSPISSNIIAMEAYSRGRGIYTLEQINDLFFTAYLSFSSAKLQSENKITINSGDWGTGAYGGNKILLACIQLLAANFSNIDKVLFYTFDKESFQEAYLIYQNIVNTSKRYNINNILSKLEKIKFKWNISDGN